MLCLEIKLYRLYNKWNTVTMTWCNPMLQMHLQMYWICSHKQMKRGGPPAWEFGGGLVTFSKKTAFCEILHSVFDVAGSCDMAMK